RFIPLAQTPNKKVLGGDFFLWIYNLSDTAKNNGFQRLLRRIGEPPVLIDTTTTAQISKEMTLYMAAKGYFNAQITDSIRYKKRKAYVDYNVSADTPFIVSSVNYKFNDASLRPII
ncbi:MAG: hypothetical protein RR277_06455, partial [Rikenellaceae bacterium]